MIVGATLKKEMSSMVSGRILFDEPMSKYTSMGVGGKVDILFFPKNVKDVTRAVSFLTKKDIPFLAVGSGTNLIVKDGGYRGCLISLKELQKVEINEGSGKEVSLYAESGVPLSRLIDVFLKESLEGMEFCAGIPGSVGGGVWMNAGAYGREMKDTITSVFIVNGNGKTREVKREDLRFEYRRLDLPEGAVITGAIFGLSKGHKEEIRKRIVHILNSRREKHPLEKRSAGSVFKNPSHCPAGKIVDELGLKGIKQGGAMISEKHGNFIVNTGEARAEDIIALIDMVRKRALETKGIKLETEVEIIGEEL